MEAGSDGVMLLVRRELLLEGLRRPQTVALWDETPPRRPNWLAAQERLLLHQLGHSLMSLGQRLESYGAAPLAAGKQ